jgi:hypothetical protein
MQTGSVAKRERERAWDKIPCHSASLLFSPSYRNPTTAVVHWLSPSMTRSDYYLSGDVFIVHFSININSSLEA